ncbi:MAG TPA: DivIVA domain-containing protein [Solirubrobacteraceae bacterium]|nr:DivIVA domain-containing protein [Solirubrobacteraceae bacterium]
MSDFERSGMAYDEPAKRRSPGTFFADLGDRLAKGFTAIDRPADEEPEWDPHDSYEEYEEHDQPTAVADALPWEQDHHRKRFPTALHGYDRDAVDAHLAALEREMAELRAQRSPASAIEEELERLGAETSAVLRVAHEQAAEITRRARVQADRCVADAAANAVAMTEDAKNKLRQLDTETDAVWAERGRLIEDVRNVATSLFSLAEDASDRFPEDGDRSGATVAAAVPVSVPASAPPSAPGSAPPSGPTASAPAPVIAPEPASAPTSGPVTHTPTSDPVTHAPTSDPVTHMPTSGPVTHAGNAQAARPTPPAPVRAAPAPPAAAPGDDGDSESRPD